MRLLTTLALMCLSCPVVFGQGPGESTPLKVGDEAPNFVLPATSGSKVTLADFKGKNPVVLAFFPAAFTGGWTKEMTAYQAGIAKFEGYDTKVFGISADNVPSLKEFAEQLKLSYPLLSDFRDRSTLRAYGVLRPDGMANRVTYVIDKGGRIAFVDVGNTAIDPTAADTACSRLAHGAATQSM